MIVHNFRRPSCQLLSMLALVVIASAANLGCGPPSPPTGTEPTTSSIPSGPPPPPGPLDSSSTAGSAAVPSLGDITAVYFTELPGVDIPGEPAPRKVGEVITFEQAHAVNKNKALLPLLKGREQLYSTTDRKCEIWIPGAIVLQIGESNSRERAYFIRTPSEQAYAFEVYEAPLDPGDMPDAVIKQVHDDLEATWTRDGGTVIHRRSVVTNGISGEELLVQDDARKVAVLSHCYCVDSTFYRLAEASTPRLEPTPTGKKFFESFRRRS